MIKTLVFDIDGTICAGKDELSSLLTTVLQTLKDTHSIAYMLASGRPYVDILSFMKKNELDCDYIMMNGAALIKQDVVHYPKEIPLETKQKVIRIFEEYDLPYACFGAKTSFCKNASDVTYAQQMERLYSCEDSIEELNDAMVTFEDSEAMFKEPILKIESISFHEEKMAKAFKALSQIEHLHLVSSMKHNLEVTDYHANKGNCILEYLKDHNIKKDEVMVFGDSENDQSMFEVFPNSVFVNNDDHIRYLTKYVTKPCKEDGVAHFLIDYFHLSIPSIK